MQAMLLQWQSRHLQVVSSARCGEGGSGQHLTKRPTGPSTSSPTSLFRQEVIDFQEIERQFGRAILLQPVSLKVITWSLAIFLVLALSLLIVGQYSRKATVSGYLTPASGTARIFALQRGTITQVHVTEGQEVKEQQPLLTIDTTQISGTGRGCQQCYFNHAAKPAGRT